jgi:hypothetical protein
MIDVTFFLRLNTDAVHATDLPGWQHQIALDTDTQVTTWPEVYEFVARSYLAGGDYPEMVITSGVDVETANDGPDIGTDVSASEAAAGVMDGSVAQVWATDTSGWPDEDA